MYVVEGSVHKCYTSFKVTPRFPYIYHVREILFLLVIKDVSQWFTYGLFRRTAIGKENRRDDLRVLCVTDSLPRGRGKTNRVSICRG